MGAPGSARYVLSFTYGCEIRCRMAPPPRHTWRSGAISMAFSLVTILITLLRGLMTLLITTHEPQSSQIRFGADLCLWLCSRRKPPLVPREWHCGHVSSCLLREVSCAVRAARFSPSHLCPRCLSYSTSPPTAQSPAPSCSPQPMPQTLQAAWMSTVRACAGTTVASGEVETVRESILFGGA